MHFSSGFNAILKHPIPPSAKIGKKGTAYSSEDEQTKGGVFCV